MSEDKAFSWCYDGCKKSEGLDNSVVEGVVLSTDKKTATKTTSGSIHLWGNSPLLREETFSFSSLRCLHSVDVYPCAFSIGLVIASQNGDPQFYDYRKTEASWSCHDEITQIGPSYKVKTTDEGEKGTRLEIQSSTGQLVKNNVIIDDGESIIPFAFFHYYTCGTVTLI